jgi:hypothetical protein
VVKKILAEQHICRSDLLHVFNALQGALGIDASTARRSLDSLQQLLRSLEAQTITRQAG